MSGLPRLPAPVELSVRCGVAGDRRRVRHTVTIGRDWTLDTTHDLAVERVARALGGGRLTCAVLAEETFPAVVDTVARWHRAVPPGLVLENAAARPAVVPDGCACATSQPLAPDACGRHLRSPAHWARVRGARASAVESLLADLVAAHPGLAEPAMPRPGPADRDRLVDRADWVWLWDLGVHPRAVVEVLDVLHPLAVDGSPASLPVGTIVALTATGTAPGGWWSAMRGLDPVSLAWVARHHRELSEADPTVVAGWIVAGVGLPDIPALVAGGYAVDEVDVVAAAAGISRVGAAHRLAGWVAAGARPSIAEVVRVYDRDAVPPSFAPRATVLDALERAVPRGPRPPTRAGLAGVLAVAGSTTEARALLLAGATDDRSAQTLLDRASSRTVHPMEVAS